MELPTKKRALTAIGANLSRLLLGAVLIASGFTKAVDPKGLFYKLKEYATAFSLDALPDIWVEITSLMLPAVEFILGAMLFMGVYNRLVTRLIFVIFLLFTPFTLLIALWNPVQDCGCFGDALHLSNWATFAKNMLLLALAAMVCINRRLFVRKISTANRWLVGIFSTFFIFAVEIVGVHDIPIIDYRPFAEGADLRKATTDIESEYKTIYRLEKEGRTEEFTDETYPDSTWHYLGSRTDIIKKGRPAQIPDFAFLDTEGNDYAQDILSDSGYVFILVMHNIETADESRVDKINELYDYCIEHKIPFYAATASDEDYTQLWSKRTGAEYPILWADDIMLKTMIRANPGVLLLKDGVVERKWSVEYMPSIDSYNSETPLAELTKEKSAIRNFRYWIAVFPLSMLFVTIIDIILYRKKREKKTTSDINNINSKN